MESTHHDQLVISRHHSPLPPPERVIFNIPGIKLYDSRTPEHASDLPVKSVLPVDEGVFLFTRKRISFFGENHCFEILLEKLVTLKPTDDGIVVSVDKKKFQNFSGMNEVQIWFICIYTIFSLKAHIRSVKN